MKRTAIVLTSLFALSCAKSSPPAPSPAPSTESRAPDARYTKPPAPGPIGLWSPPVVIHETFERGPSLWHLNYGVTPLVTIQVVFPRGASTDPPGKEGLTRLTADLLDEGAGPFGALELSDALSLLSTDYHAEVGLDYTLLTMNCLAENLEASLELLGHIVLRPQLSEAEFKRRQDDHVAQAIARSDDPGQQMQDQLEDALFGAGYAGPPEEGTLSSLRSLRLSDVRAHAKALLSGEGAQVVVVGPVKRVGVRVLLEKYLGALSGKSTLKPRALAAPPAGRSVRVVSFPGAAQSALGIALRAGPALDSNYFKELVMNQKLGGSFTSRINLNLREDKGYTYGAFSTFRRFRDAGYFAILANVHTEATGPSVREIFAELSGVCDGKPLSTTEHQDAVDGLLLGYPLRFETVADVGKQLVTLPIYDRSPTFFSEWPEKVRAVTLDEAQKAALPYCDPTRYDVVVAGDPEKVVPQLRELGLEPLVVPRTVDPKAK